MSDRIQAIVAGFNLRRTGGSGFFVACLLVRTMRQEHRAIDIVGRTSQALAEALIAQFIRPAEPLAYEPEAR